MRRCRSSHLERLPGSATDWSVAARTGRTTRNA